MSEITFLVQGSAAEPYETTIFVEGDNLTAICTCPAGTYGNVCKHRISILEGDGKAVVSDNAAEVSTVTEWVKGTDVEVALLRLRAAEKAPDVANQALKDAKKALANAMND